MPSGRASPAEQARALLEAARKEATRLGRHDLIAPLDRERRRLSAPTCHVLVVGEPYSGKSSLVNALLGQWVCGVDAGLSTAIPTLVRDGGSPSAELLRRTAEDGDDEGASAAEPSVERRGLPPAQASLLAFDDEPGVPGSQRWLEVCLPHDLLRRGIVLIDTPPVGGGLAAAQAAATLRALRMADAVVFTSDCGQEYSAAEIAFLRKIAQMGPTLICALTKTDIHPAWRTILELDRAHLRDAGLRCGVLPLAAPLRQHALRTGERTADTESGYPALEALLTRIADESILAGPVRSAANTARSVLLQLGTEFAAEQAGLNEPGPGRELLGRLENAKRQSEHLRSHAARWQRTLNDEFNELVSDIDMDLSVRLRRIRRDALQRLGEIDPAKHWTDFHTELCTRVNDEAASHFVEMQQRAALVAEEVTGLFTTEASQVVGADVTALVSPTPVTLPEGQLEHMTFGRASVFDLGLSTVRATTSSAVIVGMVAGIASATILIPVGVALAAVLARKGIRSVREAQLRVRRNEASRAVTAYLEDTELVARKSSRDALRRMNSQLRDHFGALAVEMGISADRNLQAATRAVSVQRDEQRERLQSVAGDLRRVKRFVEVADALVAGAAPPAGAAS